MRKSSRLNPFEHSFFHPQRRFSNSNVIDCQFWNIANINSLQCRSAYPASYFSNCMSAPTVMTPDNSETTHLDECVIKSDSLCSVLNSPPDLLSRKAANAVQSDPLQPYFKCKYWVFIGAPLPVLWQWAVDLKEMEICHQWSSSHLPSICKTGSDIPYPERDGQRDYTCLNRIML